jgi:putative FmdB family regulatory protein
VPLYDYDCANCGRRFEVMHGVEGAPPTACPLCGGGPVKKAFAAPAIHFKGSGWAKKERRATVAPGRPSGSSSGDPDGDGGGSDRPSDAKGDAAEGGTKADDSTPSKDSSGSDDAKPAKRDSKDADRGGSKTRSSSAGSSGD